jgi:hypothetical protein
MAARRVWSTLVVILAFALGLLVTAQPPASSVDPGLSVGSAAKTRPTCRPKPQCPSPTPPPTTPPPAAYPDASTTGVPAGTVLTRASSCEITASGVTVDAQDWACDLTVWGDDVTVTRSRIRGVVRNPGARLTLADVTIAPDTPTIRNVAPIGQDTGDYTLTRVNLFNLQDGPRTSHGHTVIRDSYVHDLAFATGEHPDALQQYCPGCVSVVEATHNTFSGCAGNSTDRGSSSVFWSDNPGAGSSFTLTDSLLRCGQFGLRLNDACASCGVSLSMTGVVIEAGSYVYGPAECRLSAASSFAAWDVKLSTGEPVTLASCLGA